VARLKRGGFTLLDTQFVTPHLAQFGAVEVPRRSYKQMLRTAMELDADWNAWPAGTPVRGADILAALGEPAQP
jgi:leucyl/phenylalanyl-tRNA--protein transferase